MQHLHKTLVIRGILLVALALVVFQSSGLGATGLAAGPDETVAEVVTWGPSYDNDDTIVAPERDRAGLDVMRAIDQRTLKGQRLSPSYAGHQAIVPASPQETVFNGVAWGPSYDTGQPTVRREAPSFMSVIDERALEGQRLSPSYTGDETIIGAKPGATVAAGQRWGPSYNGTDVVQHRPELDLMQTIDPNVLRNVTQGPSYQR